MTDYVTVMDSFVNTPRDLELLVENGIIENCLADNSEVSTLINNLGRGFSIGYNNFYYAGVCEDLKTHCGTPWHKWKTNLRQNYLNTPWAITSVIAAVFLLILTLIQAVCSIISTV
ncbi:UPF0481 protein [Prunus yedoensis var. nudiflora]|uniref:UPF0481 protein n=1 Tax=Prunus yedoensis var. nudiflora TaxID=2094558 RepID=A0A314Y5X2_PRUYE|nr:UPF0481 protein [Prunus yedoensis var. nudiflora]